MLAGLVCVGICLQPAMAQTGDCPFGDIRSVSASMMTVTINDQLVPVRGLLARTAFESALYDCGQADAVPYFREWRRMRRWTNVGIIAGFPSVGLFWVGAGVTAIRAGTQRELMLVALRPEQRL